MKSLIRSSCVAAGTAVMFAISTPAARAVQYADFVFVIDATSSMGGEITAVKNGLSGFVSGLNTAEIDARFAVVLFGGPTELVLDFTTSEADTIGAFSKISVGGAVSGFQVNHDLNPEAGLEAIRIVLNEAVDNDLRRDNVGGSGPLDFRASARKNIILVTDEDSDRPYSVANREDGQTSNDPPGTLTAGWQAEIDKTADAVIENKAFVNMIINRSDTPSMSQYGDPNLSVSDPDFLNFDPDATLLALQTAGLDQCLEAQVLDAGLVGRAFSIASISTENFIDNFFAAKIEEIKDNPLPPAGVPDAGSTFALLGLSLLLLGSRKRRNP